MPLSLFVFGEFLLFIFIWTILKIFVEFVTVLLLFYVLVFWPGGMCDLLDQGLKPAPLTLECKIFTTGPG